MVLRNTITQISIQNNKIQKRENKYAQDKGQHSGKCEKGTCKEKLKKEARDIN